MHKTLAELIPTPGSYRIGVGMESAAERPDLAVKVASIFALSAELDLIKAGIMIYALRSEPYAAMEMFTSLRSAQAPALKAVVRSKTPSRTKLFDAALTLVDKFEKHRNKFAHWTWATVDQLPKHLAVVDPKAMLTSDAHHADAFNVDRSFDEAVERWHKKNASFHDERRAQIHLYDNEAFDALLDQGAWAQHVLYEFHAGIATLGEDPAGSDQIFAELGSLLQPDQPSNPT
ncbi:MAG: hypothetical protein R3C52_10795 [Hyphomonadaceae bacterium]